MIGNATRWPLKISLVFISVCSYGIDGTSSVLSWSMCGPACICWALGGGLPCRYGNMMLMTFGTKESWVAGNARRAIASCSSTIFVLCGGCSPAGEGPGRGKRGERERKHDG